jgi:hypothetical protein
MNSSDQSVLSQSGYSHPVQSGRQESEIRNEAYLRQIHSVSRDVGGVIHYNILLSHVRTYDPEKHVGNRWHLCCSGLFVFQVLFGPRPILFRRSDGTTPLQPMQVSKAGDTHVVGTHLAGVSRDPPPVVNLCKRRVCVGMRLRILFSIQNSGAACSA